LSRFAENTFMILSPWGFDQVSDTSAVWACTRPVRCAANALNILLSSFVGCAELLP
jgi:hypothetical protein